MLPTQYSTTPFFPISLEAQSAALSRGVCHEWRSDSWDTQGTNANRLLNRINLLFSAHFFFFFLFQTALV
jgi:hypothetical protein